MDILGSLDLSVRGMTKVSHNLPCCRSLTSHHVFLIPFQHPRSLFQCALKHTRLREIHRVLFISERRQECRHNAQPPRSLQLLWPRLLLYVVPAQYTGMLIPVSRCVQALAERGDLMVREVEELDAHFLSSMFQGRSRNSASELC